MKKRVRLLLCASVLGSLPISVFAAPVESFTPSQVAHGKQVFSTVCSQCHGSNPGSPYSAASYKMKTLGELYSFVSTKMPANNPGSLSDKDYADVLALFLSTSGRPAGQKELTPELARSSVAALQP